MSAVLFPLEGAQSLWEVSTEWLGKVMEGPDASSVIVSFPGIAACVRPPIPQKCGDRAPFPSSVVTENHSPAVWWQSTIPRQCGDRAPFPISAVSAHPWQCPFGRSSVEAMTDHFLNEVDVSSLAIVDFEGIMFCASLGRQGRQTKVVAQGHWIYKARKGQKKLDYPALEEVTMEFLFIHISKAFLMKN